MRGLRQWALQLPKGWTVCFALISAILIGLVDYFTGFDFQITAFYLFPILWACWAAGRTSGVILAAASAIISEVAEITAGHAMYPIWDGLMLFTVFFVAVQAVSGFLWAHRDLVAAQISLRRSNEQLEETVLQRTATLRSEIAERERIQQEKLHAQVLLERQEKLAVLGTLTAGIAHEIRNPLTSIKARLYTLEKHLLTVPAAKRDVDIISAEISRLERVVKEALSFARPSDPSWETISAQNALREIQRLMAPSLEARGIELLAEPGPDLLIRADGGHLKQVLINLVRNASESIEGPGKVTVRAKGGRLSHEGQEIEGVILEVSDTGKGIPPEVQKRLFDPFFSTKDTGTGIGLSIAARIIQQHRGIIQFRTELGCGTTFEILLPAAGPDIPIEESSEKVA